MGSDPKYVCQKPQPKVDQNLTSVRSPLPTDTGSSDEEDEEDELATAAEATAATTKPESSQEASETL